MLGGCVISVRKEDCSHLNEQRLCDCLPLRCNYILKGPSSVERSADMTWGTCLNFDVLTPCLCLCFKRHCPSTAQGVGSNVVVVFQSQEMRKTYGVFLYLVRDSNLGQSWSRNHYTVYVIAGGLRLWYDVMQYGSYGVVCQ